MSLNEHDVVLPGLMDMEETPPPTRPPPVSKALNSQQTEVVAKRNQSKYDFVKVRVWVEDHVYVLSRYLLCRALVSAKVLIGLRICIKRNSQLVTYVTINVLFVDQFKGRGANFARLEKGQNKH